MSDELKSLQARYDRLNLLHQVSHVIHSTLDSQQALELIGSLLSIANWPQTLAPLSATQEYRLTPPGEAPLLFFQVLDLACRMHSRAESLSGEVRRESL